VVKNTKAEPRDKDIQGGNYQVAQNLLDEPSHSEIVHCIRPFLQCHEVRQSAMDSWIILIISALTMVYLLYALLRPEKF
jgi:K+-transporting ATPase KdpF subunit